MKSNLKKEELLSKEKIKELVTYNLSTGIFVWNYRGMALFGHCKNPQRACNSWNSKYANKIAGNEYKNRKSKTPYIDIRITIKGKTKLYPAHRLVFLYLNGRFPLEDIDHIDGNGLNNKRDNLREVSNQENHKNRSINSNNTSGVVGIYWNKQAQKWEASIHVNGKKIYGGIFTNKKDAIQKRKKLEIEYGFHKNHGRKQGEK